MVLLWAAVTPSMAQVIPSARCFTNSWRNAGRPGEIPAPARIVNVLDYGAMGNGVNNDAPAINAAIAALGATGGVVFLPSGTYAVPNNVVSLHSNVVLRGERSFNTEILATNLLVTQTPVIAIYGSDPGTPWMDIQSGYDLHSTTVTLTNVSPFAAGDWVETHEGTNASWKMSAWGDMVGQILQVTNVTFTTPPAGTLTFATPLRLQYEPGLLLNGVPINPQIRKFNRAIRNAGVENLRVSRLVAGDSTNRNNVASIWLRYAVNCWVRSCEFTNVFGSGIAADYSANCELTGNYIHHAYEFDGGGSGYGVVFQYKCSEMLVENNIFQRLRHSMLTQAGVNGNVFGYNYSEDQWKNEGIPMAIVADMVCHGNYPYANLFEGNCGAYISVDSSHGMNGPHNTFFRNRARIKEWFMIGYFGGIEVTDPLCTNQTFVGNEGSNTYSVACTGLFEYANNTNGVITPAGTDSLPDYSYYLGNSVTSPPPVPGWWNIPGFIPVYGPTNAPPIPPFAVERDIPARARFMAAGPKTYGPPSLYRQPTNLVVSQGEAAQLSVSATGTPAAVFQWYRNGAPLPAGTNASLVLSPADLPDAGLYWAVITDACGQVTSASATLTVQRVYYPILATASGHGTIDPSGTVSTAYGTISNFSITAEPYHHIAEVLTSGVIVAEAAELTNYAFAWGPTYAAGTAAVTFAENQTTHGTPEWWLAHYGLTGPDFETASMLDSDDDGHANWMEYVANTSPTNRGSALRIMASLCRPGTVTGMDYEIGWSAASNRVYGIWWATNAAHVFEPLATNLEAFPPTNSYTHSNVVAPSAFYRITVK